MDKLLEQLVTMVARLQELAPQVWHAAYLQVRVMAWTSLFWGVVALLVAIAASYAEYRLWRDGAREKHYNYATSKDEPGSFTVEVSVALCLIPVVIVVALFVAASDFNSAFNYFVNPDWHAIKLLINQVR